MPEFICQTFKQLNYYVTEILISIIKLPPIVYR